jgi:uncharacterized membrane protein
MKLWHRRRDRDGAPPSGRPVRGRIVIALEKALDVRAPLRTVFDACGRVERLPDILPHVREARPIAGDHHHWVLDEAEGPAIEWDTVVTRFGSNQVLAWETAPGSVIRHAGRLAFRPNADGSTRVSVDVSYVLPPGPFGERVAALVSGQELEDALRRWRARMEGAVPATR